MQGIREQLNSTEKLANTREQELIKHKSQISEMKRVNEQKVKEIKDLTTKVLFNSCVRRELTI